MCADKKPDERTNKNTLDRVVFFVLYLVRTQCISDIFWNKQINRSDRPKESYDERVSATSWTISMEWNGKKQQKKKTMIQQEQQKVEAFTSHDTTEQLNAFISTGMKSAAMKSRTKRSTHATESNKYYMTKAKLLTHSAVKSILSPENEENYQQLKRTPTECQYKWHIYVDMAI